MCNARGKMDPHIRLMRTQPVPVAYRSGEGQQSVPALIHCFQEDLSFRCVALSLTQSAASSSSTTFSSSTTTTFSSSSSNFHPSFLLIHHYPPLHGLHLFCTHWSMLFNKSVCACVCCTFFLTPCLAFWWWSVDRPWLSKGNTGGRVVETLLWRSCGNGDSSSFEGEEEMSK